MDSGQQTVDSGRRSVDGGQQTVDGRQQTVDSGQQTVDSGQQTVDSGQRSVDNRERASRRSPGHAGGSCQDSEEKDAGRNGELRHLRFAATCQDALRRMLLALAENCQPVWVVLQLSEFSD